MFRTIMKRKELIDREIAIYKQEQLLIVAKSIEDYRSTRQAENRDLAIKCHEQLAEYEHDYHFAKEVKGIEIAKLQSKLESLAEVVKAREEVIKADNNLLQSKDQEIKRLNDIVTLMINKQPQQTTIIQQK